MFFSHLNSKWEGPYTSNQLLSLESFTPSTWIKPQKSEEMIHAGDSPILMPLFMMRINGAINKYSCPRCHVGLIQAPYEGTRIFQCSFCKGHLLERGVLERIIARRDKEFSEEEIKKAKNWRKMRIGNLHNLCQFPNICCPACSSKMSKSFHSSLTSVVVDQCLNSDCRAVWCDNGELETIQILVENAVR